MNDKFKVTVHPLPYALDTLVMCDRTDKLLDEIHSRGGCKQMEIQAAAVIHTAIGNVAMHIAARQAKGQETFSIREFLEPLIADAEQRTDCTSEYMKKHAQSGGLTNIFGLIINPKGK